MFKRILTMVAAGLIGVGCATSSNQANAPINADGTAAKVEPVDFKEFPEGAIRAAAADIERQVSEGNREPTLAAPDGLILDTPRIRQAVRTRAVRAELVNTMLDSGHAWERENGRLWVIRTGEYKAATTSRQRDIDAIMVNGENMDRWAIYEGIIEANKLGGGRLNEIEKIFFEVRVQHMKPGQKYESSDGKVAMIAAPSN